MLYIILLFILAVLLFGSSAVLGVIGAILGFLVAAIALTGIAITFDLGTEAMVLIIAFAVAALLVAGKLANDRYTAMLGGAEARADYEKLLAETERKLKSQRK